MVKKARGKFMVGNNNDMRDSLILHNETQKLVIYKETIGSKTHYYRLHKEDESQSLVKIYTVDEDQSSITFNYSEEGIEEVVLEGFDEIPQFISAFGYGFSSRDINNFFRYNFGKEDGVKRIVLSKDSESKKKRKSLYINTKDFEDLSTSIGQEQYACNQTKKTLIKNFLSEKFPSLSFEFKEYSSNKDLILRNLNSKLLSKLTADEVEEIGKFYIEAAQKFSRQDVVKRMLVELNKSTKLITLNEVVKKYEKLLDDDPAESEWQKFFDQYITLFDNRYIYKLDYKNIATGLTKYPDLVLVDIYGYVDFYELKKSSTPLLKYDGSHKTYYWSPDVAKVIAQVSNYLQKAKENALSYANTIKEETGTEGEDGLDVNIINPKAIIVAGSTKELNSEKKRNHFKNLRESLKDIEFVLYDELLDRLRNLLTSLK